MRAKDVMTSPVATVGLDATVQEIAKLLIERRVSGVPVLDTGGRVVGIVSEGDLMRRVEHADERHRSWWRGCSRTRRPVRPIMSKPTGAALPT